MNTIEIEWLSGYQESGTLTIRDLSNAAIGGPWPLTIGNVSAETSFSMTSTHSRALEFIAADIVDIGEGNAKDVETFGRYGIVRLLPKIPPMTACLAGEVDGTCFIHGGAYSVVSQPGPPAGSFCLSPENHKKLITVLKVLGLPLNCSVKSVGNQAIPEHKGQSCPVESLKPVHRRVAVLAAAVAGLGSPFIVPPKVAEAQTTCCKSSLSYSSVDFAQLEMLEGGTQYTGHVPDDHSGVNIAAGMDLGYESEQELVDMGFRDPLLYRLRPYLAKSSADHLVGYEARSILKENPLTVTNDEADEINRLFFSWHANVIGTIFNRELQANPGLKHITFASLSPAFQTAMTNMQVADHQFGHSAAFRQLAGKDWSTGLSALRHYEDERPAVIARAKSVAETISQLDRKLLLPYKLTATKV